MKNQERSYILFLEDIVTSMDRIQQYISNLDFTSFKESNITVDAVVRNFEIIGEAVKNLPGKLKSEHPQIPWDQMYRLRNQVSHGYFGVNYEIIWEIAVNHLPVNRADIVKILTDKKREKSP